MSSAASEDLTARARIRDTAVTLFGRDGFGVSVRAVAERAGVSPGLVIHHFGSKAKLREACDDHILRLIAETKGEAVARMSAAGFLEQLADVGRYGDVFSYLMRSLQEGGQVVAALVERMARDVEAYLADGERAGTIRPSRDPKARARYAVSMALGSLSLHWAMHPRDTDPAALLYGWMDAYMLPALELYTEPLLLDRTFLDTYVAHLAAQADARRADPPAEAPGTPAETPEDHRT